MSGLRVGIDHDGVLSAFEKEFCSYIATIEGLEEFTLDNADLTDWHFFRKWPGWTTQKFMEHFLAGVDAGHIFSQAEPEEGAVEATHLLHEAGHSVHIVTDCSLGTIPGTSQRARVTWLAKHGFYFDSITFTPDKTSIETDVFLDDKIQNFKSLLTSNSTPYICDRPWNQKSNPDWGDMNSLVLDYIDERFRVDSALDFAKSLSKEKVSV